MCRFKPTVKKLIAVFLQFKYITCVGSSRRKQIFLIRHCLFKYITCVGSRLVMTSDSYGNGNLNTSHVSVQESGQEV